MMDSLKVPPLKAEFERNCFQIKCKEIAKNRLLESVIGVYSMPSRIYRDLLKPKCTTTQISSTPHIHTTSQ